MRDITKESRKKANKELRVKKDVKKEKVYKKAATKMAKLKAERKQKMKKNPKEAKKARKERELKLCIKDAGHDKTARKACQGVVLAASLLGALEDAPRGPSGWDTTRVMV